MSTIEQRITALKEVAGVASEVAARTEVMWLRELAQAVEVVAAIVREGIEETQAPSADKGDAT